MATSSLQQSFRNVVLMVEALIAAALVIGVATIIFAVMASAGEIITCIPAPPDGQDEGPDRFVYRFVPKPNGELATCWFVATPGMRRGRQMPLERLKWPEPSPTPIEITEPMREPWCPSDNDGSEWII